jgi:hypothetical protein
LKRNSKVPTKNKLPDHIAKDVLARNQAAAKTTANVSSSVCSATISVNAPDARIANLKPTRLNPIRVNHLEARRCRESGAAH